MPVSQAKPEMADDNNDRFEDLITDLAASFVNAEATALDAQIVEALRRLTLALGIDRAMLGRFDVRKCEMMPSHSWAKAGVKPLPSVIPTSATPYVFTQIIAGNSTVLPRITDLPPEASTDLAFFAQKVGLKSVAIFPLWADGEVFGWLSFGSLQSEQSWPERLATKLRVIAKILANALSRRDKEECLREALEENVGLREKLEAENAVWRDEILHCRDFDEIVGESPLLRRLMSQVDQVAQTDSTVLLLGETGTGKELIATAIHKSSLRATRPLVRVNCAALPATLIESELFGHEKGAFTGAVTRRPGRFELAHEGTLVLDEIGELPLDLQPSLLRALESGEFERLGGSKTLRTNCRVIASTNRDLEKMVDEGKFRADLFYRLTVFPITVPPLRERKEDIPLLVAYFIEKLRAQLGRNVIWVPDKVIDELLAYDWPGNVRELENIVERSMILSHGTHLEITGIPRKEQKRKTDAASVRFEESGSALARTLAEVERDHIGAVCELCGWKINGAGGAAEMLDIKPNTLRSRMKKLGIERPLSAARPASPRTRS